MSCVKKGLRVIKKFCKEQAYATHHPGYFTRPSVHSVPQGDVDRPEANRCESMHQFDSIRGQEKTRIGISNGSDRLMG